MSTSGLPHTAHVASIVSSLRLDYPREAFERAFANRNVPLGMREPHLEIIEAVFFASMMLGM